ncbi:hypothetical protein KAR91_55745 [Candidatus Pacearchaeota archaeon]|nr:hypothetical protein [Candidatus Pacearchaeota archaeon]
MNEIDRVDIASANSKFKNMKRLINAALDEGLLVNPLSTKPYSYHRVDGMLREGMGHVADKLVDFAKENPRE